MRPGIVQIPGPGRPTPASLGRPGEAAIALSSAALVHEVEMRGDTVPARPADVPSRASPARGPGAVTRRRHGPAAFTCLSLAEVTE